MATATGFELEGKFDGGDNYAVEGEGGGQALPWLQANIKQPQGANDLVLLGLSSKAAKSLADGAMATVPHQVINATFGADTETFYAMGDGVRWVILARPRLFALNKEDDKISELSKGMVERGEISVTRVLLACVVGDDFVRGDNGKIQVFTLKLTSTKTGFLGNAKDKDLGLERNDGDRTIAQLNQHLVTHFDGKPNQWFGHTVSVELAVWPVYRKSAKKSTAKKVEGSWSNKFGFAKDSKARALPPALAKEAFEFVTTEEFKALAANPFGGGKVAEKPKSMAVEDGGFDEDF